MNRGLIFASGALLGSAVGFFIGYKKAYRNMQKNTGTDLYDSENIPGKYLRETSENNEEKTDKESRNREELDSIKEKLTDNWSRTTNYAAAYDLKAEPEARGDDDEGEELENMLGNMDEETMAYLAEREGREPKIISETALGELPPGIDHQCLFYWQYDDTLTTEDDEVIEDVERFIGDSLIKYGFSDDDEKIIFVINYELGTVYEIQKYEKAFHTD